MLGYHLPADDSALCSGMTEMAQAIFQGLREAARGTQEAVLAPQAGHPYTINPGPDATDREPSSCDEGFSGGGPSGSLVGAGCAVTLCAPDGSCHCAGMPSPRSPYKGIVYRDYGQARCEPGKVVDPLTGQCVDTHPSAGQGSIKPRKGGGPGPDPVGSNPSGHYFMKMKSTPLYRIKGAR